VPVPFSLVSARPLCVFLPRLPFLPSLSQLTVAYNLLVSSAHQVGYSIQGAFKFGGYEFWKKQAVDYYGVEAARENRQAIYLGASAIAEFFADVALCVRSAPAFLPALMPTHVLADRPGCLLWPTPRFTAA
jgi:hypothetical protein